MEKKRFLCRHVGCEKSYSTQSHRTRHEDSCKLPDPHDGKKKLKAVKYADLFRCATCQKTYKNKSSIYRH